MAVTVEPALHGLDGVEAVEAHGVRMSAESNARLAAVFRDAPPGLRR